MSQFLPESGGQTKDAGKGPESYLTSDERRALQRSLSFPEDLPPKFKSWLLDFVALNIPQIPVSQIVGFKQVEQVEVSTATIVTQQTTTSGSPANLATVGPQLTELRNGTYVIFFGAECRNSGTDHSRVYLKVNADTPTVSCAVQDTGDTSISRSTAVELTNDDANTLLLQYAVGGGTGTFANRWIVAQRIGSASGS